MSGTNSLEVPLIFWPHLLLRPGSSLANSLRLQSVTQYQALVRVSELLALHYHRLMHGAVMKMLASSFFILLFLIHQVALAGTIYKCKDAKGVVIFQQVACAAGQRIGAKSFQPVPDSPNRASNDELEEQLERLEAIVAEQRQSLPPSASPSNVQEDIKPSGYMCNDGRTQWVQSDPCPASTSRYESRFVNGVTTTGAPISGTISQKVANPVEQQELSRSEMCEQLRSNPATKSRGASANSTYERNKMRDANGC